MKKRLFTNLGAMLAVITLLFAFTTPSTDHINFSGTWVLNESISELGQFGARAAAKKVVIVQEKESLSFTATSSDMNNQEVTSQETLTNDGKPSETLVFGSANKKSTLAWSEDGNSFTVTSQIALERNGQSFEMSTVQVWSLGAEGKVLTVKTNLTTPQGQIQTRAAYDKK